MTVDTERPEATASHSCRRLEAVDNDRNGETRSRFVKVGARRGETRLTSEETSTKTTNKGTSKDELGDYAHLISTTEGMLL